MITAGAEANDDIRTQVVRNYRQFVADVDPKGGIMDHLIEAGVVSIETKERIVSHVTRQVGLATARNRPIGPYQWRRQTRGVGCVRTPCHENA